MPALCKEHCLSNQMAVTGDHNRLWPPRKQICAIY